jgi:hypothetical protein
MGEFVRWKQKNEEAKIPVSLLVTDGACVHEVSDFPLTPTPLPRWEGNFFLNLNLNSVGTFECFTP